MLKWIIIIVTPIIVFVVLFTGWFLSRISKMADEFFQYASIVEEKINNIKSVRDYDNAIDAYNQLIKLDVLGKGAPEIMRLARRLEEVHKQLINKQLNENIN